MKTFLEYYQHTLTEKQIQYNHNAPYGQIVFFAGGAASGKGFSIANFIDSHKFRIRDVDQLKVEMLRSEVMKKKYPELRTMSLKNPEDVRRLHAIAKEEGIPEQQIMGWIMGMKNPETLPNILFDTTLKDMWEADKYIPLLIKAGYKPENIHITWVLANFKVAIDRNKTRDRVVPEDILLQTHTGAALNIANLITGGLPKSINGSFTVILNNFEEVKYYDKEVPEYEKQKLSPTRGRMKFDKTGKPITSRVVKDFKYITLKKSGRPMPSLVEMDRQIKQTLLQWVANNTPNNSQIDKAFGI